MKIKRNISIYITIYILTIISFSAFFSALAVSSEKAVPEGSPKEAPAQDSHQEYIDFFDEVYETIQNNYYRSVPRQKYEYFLRMFDENIYGKLRQTGKSIDYIRWRSAAYMVDMLKSSEDRFSRFFPPEPAKEYEQEVLGKRIDLGIEGELADGGYLVGRVEPRSDSYQKGLRQNDIIKGIGDVDVLTKTEEEIQGMLTPVEGSVTPIRFLDFSDQKEKTIDVESKEYFKQTVFLFEVGIPDIFGLTIQRFNRKTSEDMLNYLNYIESKSDDSGLILDMRGNPGGPPLAAREISAFFLTPGEEFAYFQRRDRPKALLDVPVIPKKYHYKGPMVILVNEKSGSAAELFSGVMQRRQRAVLMGVNTAGQVFLKSMFYFDDDSMVLLITARGHFPDGSVFSFNGVEPDQVLAVDDPDRLVAIAAEYLADLKKKQK